MDRDRLEEGKTGDEGFFFIWEDERYGGHLSNVCYKGEIVFAGKQEEV